MNDFCYQKQSWQHDPDVRTSNGVHPFVKVWYSPQLWDWLTLHQRSDAVPDGAMLVKEQYQTLTAPLTEWTIMVKDEAGSFDGWYWADLSAPGSGAATTSSSTFDCPEASYPSIGFGEYCVNCHGSAADGQLTFATTSHVDGSLTAPSSLDVSDNIHHRLAHQPGALLLPPNSPCMIPESLDHVVSGGKPAGPQKFITSDQCIGCHDATGTLSPTRIDLPSMLFPNALAPSMVNVSPNGEWRFSMMGLSGRDPIFFSQLNSESTLHQNLQDHPGDAKEYVQDLCLHCHGVMGQRQYQQDTGQFFTRDQLLDASSPYGALARDGVSCAVCHRIAADGLGTPETYTGNFNLGPPTEVYGPFDQDVTMLPMENVLGIEPKATPENQILSSTLCGSCHTIILPVYDSQGQRVVKNGQPAVFTEQATFLEWLNSDFADNGPTPQSCQDCHMPKDYKGTPLSYKIANIEDNTFPAVDFRAPDADITLTPREPFARHTLLGINLFALEMFRQFRPELGLYQADPMLRDPDHTAHGIDTAIASATEVAQGADGAPSQTATVEIVALTRSATKLQADVRVTNLAGHSLPSGVGFRRAFLNFQVLDRGGRVLWESGGTNPDGVIVDGAGKPLVTEFFTPATQQFQPHYWRENPITRTNQVQIYEELVVDPEGFLTTSFISLDHKVKDNRLQPRGWSTSGPSAEETGPTGTCDGTAGDCDPQYMDGSGSQVARYVVALTGDTTLAASVRATLYYQSIPPYYLHQRATDAMGTDTDRLIRFTHDLDLDGTPAANWKLPIDSATAELGGLPKIVPVCPHPPGSLPGACPGPGGRPRLPVRNIAG